MQNLKVISDRELHARTFLVASHEKKATLTLLEYLAEVDERRLFAVMGYSSLWEYVHKYLKYSESQSSERVSAMRLMARLPEQVKENTKKDLQSGQVTLTTLTQLAYHSKKEKLNSEDTAEMLGDIKGKSKREVEKILAQEATLDSRMKDKIKIKTKNTTLITIEVDEEFIQLYERIKELKGNLALTTQEVFKVAMEEYVKRREVKLEQKDNQKQKSSPNQTKSLLHPDEVSSAKPKNQSRYISKTVKNAVRVKSKDQCEYVCSETSRRCEAKNGLQYDHHLPHAVGGSNNEENLRYLCPAHNRLAAVRYYGKEKMNLHFKKAS